MTYFDKTHLIIAFLGSSTASSAPAFLPSNPSQTPIGIGQNRPMDTSAQYPMNNLLHHSQHQPVDPNSSNSSSYSRPSSSLASTKIGHVQSTDANCLSSTARLILDTLDKMSTPIRDAQKMSTAFSNNALQHHDRFTSNSFETKISRAERRRMIAETLDASSASMNLSNSSLSMQDDLMLTPNGEL